VSLTMRVLARVRPYWTHVGALLLLGLVSIPLALLAPLPLKIAVDSVIGSHPLPRPLDPLVPDVVTRSPGALLALAIGLLVAVPLLHQLQGLATALLRARLKENWAAGIQHDPPVVPYALTESLVRFISASATLIVILYVMARIDGQLALIALAIWPGLVVTAQAIRRCLRHPSREAKRLAIAAGTAAVLLVGIHHVRSGLITLGDVLLAMGYMSSAYESLWTIGRKAASLQLQLASTRQSAAPSMVSVRRSNPKRHPAVHAWCQLYPHDEPRGITPLRIGRQRRVYRLEGVGRAGTAVIAKQCPKADAPIEHTVYEEILPRVTVPSLRYYGFLEEPDSEHRWLFLEEATGVKYSRLLDAHRAQAARWLGLLHTSATVVAHQGPLPDAGPGRYLARLRAARESMQQHLDNPVLSRNDIVVIEGIRARLADLAEHWSRVEELCHDVPHTLVHGDFNGKNMRLRSTTGDPTVVVFDWADAGWGVPAVDLAQMTVPASKLSANPDLPTYCSTVSERWPDVSTAALRRLAHCGTVFRALAALSWETDSLGHEWASTSVSYMRMFEAEMAHALDALGWTPRGRPITPHPVLAE